MNKTNRERFQTIAAARTNKVINDLAILSKCSNKHNYSYTQQEVNQMLRAIDEAVKKLKQSFNEKERTETFTFK